MNIESYIKVEKTRFEGLEHYYFGPPDGGDESRWEDWMGTFAIAPDDQVWCDVRIVALDVERALILAAILEIPLIHFATGDGSEEGLLIRVEDGVRIGPEVGRYLESCRDGVREIEARRRAGEDVPTREGDE